MVIIRRIFKYIYKLFAKLHFLISKIHLRLFNVSYGSGLLINGSIFIRNRGKILIGNNVRINSTISANPIGAPYKTSFVAGENATIEIGNSVGISATAIVSQSSVIIEDNVRIGGGTCIYDTDFHSINYNSRISEKDTNIKIKPVKICEGAFVGTRCLILKGVTIGEHSVIGAGSVVTKDIPPNQVWAGNPAVFVKHIDQ